MEFYDDNIIFIRLQIQMKKELDEENGSNDEFESFQEQYLTYTQSSQLSPTNLPRKRPFNALKQQIPKLKIANEGESFDLDALLKKSSKKHISAKARSIRIGDAIFRSDFQSGNIYSVQQTQVNTYEIMLEKQLNSERMSSWFYFSCEGLKGDVKFRIKGFTKSSSLYNSGMKICYLVENDDPQWKRGGTKISYQECETENQSERQLYEINFNFMFHNQITGKVYFAYSFPYTYTHLLTFLSSISSKIKISCLGKTFQGRQIPLITIGNSKSKQAIIVSSRIHPGETVASHMMHGFMRALLEDSEYSIHLREAFVFKIVPMINPDGVVNGNYRFSAAGFDLNRKWKNCKPKLHPQIYYFRDFIRKYSKQKEVIMYIDLHGHSRQKNVFFYGCCPKGSLDKDGNRNTKPKQFPYLMSKLHPPFRYDYCCYSVQKDKEGTARITLWNELKIDYVYTLESTFCGSEGGGNYTKNDFELVGEKLCKGICLFFWKDIEKIIQKEKNGKIIQTSTATKINQELEKKMNDFFENPSLADISFEGNSDSEPEAGEITEQKRVEAKKQMQIQKIEKVFKMDKIQVKNEEKKNVPKKSKLGISEKQKKKILQVLEKEEQKTTVRKIELRNLSTRTQTRIISKKEKNPITKSQKQYFKSQILNKTINQQLYLPSEVQNKSNTYKLCDQFQPSYESEELKLQRRRLKTRKIKGFQGAQFRRVRKFAEEQNRKNYSDYQNEEEEPLIRGLNGGFFDIQKISIKQGPASFFPTSQNKKLRKGSVEVSFRRQKKPNIQNNRKEILENEMDVKCFGKHIDT